MKGFIFVVLTFSLALSLQAADQVQMKNGDRYSGTIAKVDNKAVSLKTDSGVLTIALEGVESYSSAASMYITTSEGKTVSGTVQYSNATLVVQTEESGAVTIPSASLALVRSKETYDAEVLKYEQAGLFDLWSGFLEAGLSLSHGNSDTTNLAIGANGTRSALKNKTSLYFASLYSRTDVSGESQTTANALRGGGRYETNVTDRFSVFVFTDLDHDKFQNLDVRWVLGGGPGWYLVKNSRTQFQVFGGFSYNYENFTDDTTRNSGEFLIGEQLDYTVSDRMTIAEKFVVFPNLSDTGEYRMNWDTSLLTKLNDHFGWHLTFSDRYLSNPVGDALKNDLLLSTGVRFSF